MGKELDEETLRKIKEIEESAVEVEESLKKMRRVKVCINVLALGVLAYFIGVILYGILG